MSDQGQHQPMSIKTGLPDCLIPEVKRIRDRLALLEELEREIEQTTARLKATSED